jgi:lipopolysaccharide transport system permease protein
MHLQTSTVTTAHPGSNGNGKVGGNGAYGVAAMADAAAAPEPALLEIGPPSAWQAINVRELWAFRGLLYFLTWRDVKVRYKQTALGVAWAVLQPALMMVVFTVFFGRMARVPSGDMPYPVFVYMGLLPWSFFAAAVGNASNSVIGSERLITKIYFPRLAVPFASAGAAAVDWVIAFGLLGLLMVYYRVVPGWNALMIPPIAGLIVLVAVGMGTLLAGLNVAYRDFKYVVPFMLQLWLFATPTVYMQPSAAVSGDTLHRVLAINPMTPLVGAFRAACSGEALAWGSLGIAAAQAVVIFLAGCFVFRRFERSFADLI